MGLELLVNRPGVILDFLQATYGSIKRLLTEQDISDLVDLT